MSRTFADRNSEAHRASTSELKVQLYREITQLAQRDEAFRKTIDWETFWNSTTVLSRLLNDSTKEQRLLNSVSEDRKVECEMRRIRNAVEDPKPEKIAILGYKSDLIGTWDPDIIGKGLPGSEEAVIYASEELVRRGHTVVIYINPDKDSLWRSPFSSPQWLPEDLWTDTNHQAKYDLVLMWRRFDVDTGRKRGDKVIFWPHDSPPVLPANMRFPPFPAFDGIFMLSKWHQEQFKIWPGFDACPKAICGNGYVPEQFQKPMSFTNPYSIGYFSNYARGLIVLLLLWPEIRKEFPRATLSICYGRETWNTMSPKDLNMVISMIEQYKSIGVTEHGKIGHLELAHIMQTTSIFAYPCLCLGETFCITAVKCQAAGCLPVTTRIAALNETIHPEAPQISIINSNADIPSYKELLFATLRRVEDPNILEERKRYIQYAEQFTWAQCVDKWLTLYEQIC
jgi:glycosyltransferase involved in cell wall biosynthesis